METQRKASVADNFHRPVSWICRETKEVFPSTRQVARHAKVQPSTISYALKQGKKFYHSRATGYTYLLQEV